MAPLEKLQNKPHCWPTALHVLMAERLRLTFADLTCTVMNIVSKLRAIFSAIHGLVGMENPVSLPEENSYVIFTPEEQDGVTVLPRQAIHFQPGNMLSLIHICFTS